MLNNIKHVPIDKDFLYNINLIPTNDRQPISELYNLYNLVKNTNKLDGDVVEVGVYAGTSAVFINLIKRKEKKLWLFDTFCGIQDVCEKDTLENGFANYPHFDNVKKLINDNSVSIIKGYFPNVIQGNEEFNNLKFSFVHLDVDTYTSTKLSLEFFYDKMEENGIIITHDYKNIYASGVNDAFEEFFLDKEEHIIHLWDTQGMIIKI